MIRALHRWPGLLALVLVTVLALSGAALSVFPATERLSAPQAVAGQSVGDLAARVATLHPGLEEIRRAPSGRITAWPASGEVNIGFAGGTPVCTDARTASGRLSSSLPSTGEPAEGQPFLEVRATTASGDVTLHQS